MATTIEFSAKCNDKAFEPITFDVPFDYTEELWEILRKALPSLLSLMNNQTTLSSTAKASCDMEVTRANKEDSED